MSQNLNEAIFVKRVVFHARKSGFRIETAPSGEEQIDFGNKKLTVTHLSKLYPAIVQENADVAKLIDTIAPGRPCTHKPMKEIVQKLVNEHS